MSTQLHRFSTAVLALSIIGYKGQLFEGGIRVPFLAQWKGKLLAGWSNTQSVMAFDIHATALVAAGGKLTPSEFPRADIFKQMDKNADGVVTIEEAKAFYGGRRRPSNPEN